MYCDKIFTKVYIDCILRSLLHSLTALIIYRERVSVAIVYWIIVLIFSRPPLPLLRSAGIVLLVDRRLDLRMQCFPVVLVAFLIPGVTQQRFVCSSEPRTLCQDILSHLLIFFRCRVFHYLCATHIEYSIFVYIQGVLDTICRSRCSIIYILDLVRIEGYCLTLSHDTIIACAIYSVEDLKCLYKVSYAGGVEILQR